MSLPQFLIYTNLYCELFRFNLAQVFSTNYSSCKRCTCVCVKSKGNAQPADNSVPELLPGADPEGDVDPSGLEKPLRQAVPILLWPQRRSPRRGAPPAAPAAPAAPADPAAPAAPAACCWAATVSCNTHLPFRLRTADTLQVMRETAVIQLWCVNYVKVSQLLGYNTHTAEGRTDAQHSWTLSWMWHKV